MNKNIRLVGLFLAVTILVGGCQVGETQDDLPSELPETATVETIEETQVEAQPTIEETTWDLLWVSDSSGWGVAEIYGQFIAEDNDVEVRVEDSWIGGLSAGAILQGLKEQNTKNFALDKLRDKIAESEVIVIYGNPEGSEDPSNPGDWNCGQNDLTKCYVAQCSSDTFAKYIADLKEIYRIIFEIRQGKPTIIRAIDAYNPSLVSKCEPDGVFDACVSCWEAYNEAIHQAAEAMGVPVAGVFDAWNGKDHIEDPIAKAYTQEDNVHPNELGATVIAQLLRELGYDPILP